LPTKKLHSRNRNSAPYELEAMALVTPELKQFFRESKKGSTTLDFSDPRAVRILNKAILKHYYQIAYWDYDEDLLTPGIPGRADYIHYLADFLTSKSIALDKVTCLDIGTGASCIYPIIGVVEYGWKFIGTDIDAKSLRYAQKICDENDQLLKKVELRLQKKPHHILDGVINVDDHIDITLCNPPFYASIDEAESHNARKTRNVNKGKTKQGARNFRGHPHELIYQGGELGFIKQMIKESSRYKKNVKWFSSLVSKSKNLNPILAALKRAGASNTEIIEMTTSNKISRAVVWNFR